MVSPLVQVCIVGAGAPSPVAEIYLVHSLTGWAGLTGSAPMMVDDVPVAPAAVSSRDVLIGAAAVSS